MASQAGAPDPLHLRPVELHAWRGFLTAHARIIGELDAELLSREGLSVRAYDVLLNLAQSGRRPMRMTQLAEAVLLTPSGLTRLVDRLIRDGLVERVAAEGDARGACARLTPAGRAKVRRLTRTHLAGVRERFLAYADDDELQVLGDVFARMTGERRS